MKTIIPFILGLSLCFITSCGNGPKVRIYLSDPSAGGMEFHDETTGENGFVPYAQTDKFVAMSQADAQTLFNYCRLGK